MNEADQVGEKEPTEVVWILPQAPNPYLAQLHPLQSEVLQKVFSGRLKPDFLTLAMTLDQYEAYKSDTPKAARKIGHRVERPRTDMKSVFGKQKLKYTPLTDMTRQDANDLRDDLLSRVSANSAVRMPEQ